MVFGRVSKGLGGLINVDIRSGLGGRTIGLEVNSRGNCLVVNWET